MWFYVGFQQTPTEERAQSYPTTNRDNLYAIKRMEYPDGGKGGQITTDDLKGPEDTLYIRHDLRGSDITSCQEVFLKRRKGNQNPQLMNNKKMKIKIRSRRTASGGYVGSFGL